MRQTKLALVAALVMAALAGCSAAAPSTSTSAGAPTVVRIGYLANLTHAPAMVALEQGYFEKELGKNVTVTPVVFNAGPDAIQALFANAVDMAFLGPNPTITGYTRSQGAALKVVAGAASGGAGLVVRAGLTNPADLAGAKLATPQLGNTQDVALRYWLKQQGYATTTEGGGDVHILPQDNATALQAFISGQIDGAWVPEPWLTRFVSEGKGHILVNESSLWPGKKFVVTDLISSTPFLKAHPDEVSAVLRGELHALDYMSAHPDDAKALVNKHLKELTGKAITPADLDVAWNNIDFTIDPLSQSLLTSAKHAEKVGLLDSADLTGLYDLDPLNAILKADGRKVVRGP